MPGNRIGRINEEIQRELSALLPRLKDPRVSAVGMVSVTRTDVTADLRYCKVYVSVLDKSKEKDVLRGLKSASGFLRRELGQALRLRYTPELQFQGDDSIARGARVLEVLRSVEYSHQDDPPEEPDDSDGADPLNGAEDTGNWKESEKSDRTEEAGRDAQC